MSTVSLKSHQFRLEREDSWKQLEDMLKQIEKGGASRLSDEDMINLPRLYRSTLSSLSVARATSLDQDVVTYLESLTSRAYFSIYGNQKGMFERLGHFFKVGWPKAVQSIKRETLAALIFTFVGGLIAYALVSNNPDWYFSFMPESLASGRSPASSTEYLRDGLYDGGGGAGLSEFATYLFSHNSRVAIFAFTLGFAFALPSIVLLIYNGCILGAFVALYVSKGLGYEVTGWLFIHGTTEIFAIVLAGAAGIKIGMAVAFPGQQSRTEAARLAGVQSGAVVGGVIIMLFFAGLLEGFGRQLITNDEVRYGIGALMLSLWLFYFYRPQDFVEDVDQGL